MSETLLYYYVTPKTYFLFSWDCLGGMLNYIKVITLGLWTYWTPSMCYLVIMKNIPITIFFLCEYHHSPHTRYSCTFWRSYVNQVVSSSNHTVSKDILTTLLLELFKWGIIPITTTVSFDITKLANSIKVSSYVNHRFVYKLAYSWMGTQKNLSKWYNITTYL